MTDRIKQRVEVALLAMVFGLGGGWAAYEFRLGRLEETVARIDARVSAMYCATIPEQQRAACR